MTDPEDTLWLPTWDAPSDADAERTQVFDAQQVRQVPPPSPPDMARRDPRTTVEWQLQVAKGENRASTDVGLLLLRLGSLPLVMRGLHKIVEYSGFIDSLRDNAFAKTAPELIGTLVIAGEIVLPVLLAVGLATRLAGLLQSVLMVGIFTFWTVASGALFDPSTGGLSGEPELLFAGLALPLLFTGPGRISIDRALTAAGRERRIEKKVIKRLGE